MIARIAPRPVALALVLALASASAHDAVSIDDFATVRSEALDAARAYGASNVLLVFDVDNTLLAMNQDLGSDPWFRWQWNLLENDRSSPLCVASSFDELIATQRLLYSVAQMSPPQSDLPALMRQLQRYRFPTVVLTSRNVDSRDATLRELDANGYDFRVTALGGRSGVAGTYLPYALADLAASGLDDELRDRLGLGAPRPVSYSDGVFLVAGQHKGAMLRTLLHRFGARFRAILFVDDREKNIREVSAAFLPEEVELRTFRYGREDDDVARFEASDKSAVDRSWRRLDAALYAELPRRGAAPPARIVEQGVIACFEPGLRERGEDRPVCGEASALEWDPERHDLIVAIDKRLENLPRAGTSDNRSARTSIFRMSLRDVGRGGPIARYITADEAPELDRLQKIESLAHFSHDGTPMLLAATSFSDLRPGRDDNHKLVIWPRDTPANARLVTTDDAEATIRPALAAALGLEPGDYFKVEGLTVMGRRLLFGVREVGSYDAPQAVVKVIAAELSVDAEGAWTLKTPFALVYDGRKLEHAFSPMEGLSSLEYDADEDRVYFLTSTEALDAQVLGDLGGYLWSISGAALVGGDGRPERLCRFDHKPEGMAVVAPHRLFIVCDDDRVTTDVVGDLTVQFRTREQATYYIVEDRRRPAR